MIGAGLLVRTLIELYRVNLGFDPRNVLTAQLQLSRPTIPPTRAWLRSTSN